MRTFGISAAAAVLALTAAAALVGARPAPPQSTRADRAARTPDGKPSLNGIWEALNTANWDLQAHAAQQGSVISVGAAFSRPGGPSFVDGNEIPYKPEALAQKNRNAERWLADDPEIKCYMPGVPRATYMPYPFEIVQGPEYILIAYEFAGASRTIYMNSKSDSPLDTWMGWSTGRWEGDTLVVDVRNFNDSTWFDRAGDYHSAALHVTERYTRIDANHLQYEATIDDPQVFTRPWKISMPLYRRLDKDMQLLEYKCVEFVEELMYGDVKKRTN